MFELHNWRYRVLMSIGGDRWGLSGRIFGNPKFPEGSENFTSTPKEFDEINMIVTTYSGSKYKLINCDGNLERQKEYIREDVIKSKQEKEQK